MSSCLVVVDDGNLCGEAPLWDTTQQKLYWTDCAGCRFYSYEWKAKQKELILDGFEVNGCALDRSGGFVFSSSSGVWFWDKKAKPVLVAGKLGDVELRLNDCVADP